MPEFYLNFRPKTQSSTADIIAKNTQDLREGEEIIGPQAKSRVMNEQKFE